jgi:hypothetical protein
MQAPLGNVNNTLSRLPSEALGTNAKALCIFAASFNRVKKLAGVEVEPKRRR